MTLAQAIAVGFQRAMRDAELIRLPLPATPIRHTVEQAKVELKRKGYSYRAAAPLLDVTYQHLSEVLNAKRNSRRVLVKIKTLPPLEKSQL